MNGFSGVLFAIECALLVLMASRLTIAIGHAVKYFAYPNASMPVAIKILCLILAIGMTVLIHHASDRIEERRRLQGKEPDHAVLIFGWLGAILLLPRGVTVGIVLCRENVAFLSQGVQMGLVLLSGILGVALGAGGAILLVRGAQYVLRQRSAQ